MDAVMQNALLRQAGIDPVPVDPATGQPAEQVTMEVEVLPTMQIVGREPLSQGKHTIKVYTTDVASVLALVENASQADMDAVERELERHHVEMRSGENPVHYEPSWPAAFHRVMHRSPRALRFARIVEDDKATSRRKAS